MAITSDISKGHGSNRQAGLQCKPRLRGSSKRGVYKGAGQGKAGEDLAQGLLQVGEDGTVTLGHDGEGEGAVVVLHHTIVVVALR